MAAAAIPLAGFNPARIGLHISGEDMNRRGKAFWGPGVEDGDPVDLTKAQGNAQKRYLEILESNPRAPYMMPVVDLIPQEWIQKAVFEPRGMEWYEETVKKAIEDFRSEVDAITKATTTSSNLMHSISDADVTILFKKPLVAQSLIPVEASKGKVTQWDAVGPNGAGTAFFGSEDPVLTESDITDYTRTGTNKILYAVGRLTKMARIAGQTQVPARDMMAIRTLAATEMLKNLRERSILGVTRNVQATANAFADAASLEYAGLYELVTANSTSPNFKDVSGSTIDTYDKIRPYLDETYMLMVQDGLDPNLAMCDYKTFGLFARGLYEHFRSDQVKTTSVGVAKITLVMANGEMPLVPVPFLPTAAGTNGSIFMEDTRHLARRVLWAETMEEIASGNTSTKFVIDAAEVLIDKSDIGSSDVPAYSLQGGVFGITLS